MSPKKTLRDFVVALLDDSGNSSTGWESNSWQALPDLGLLHKLSSTWGESWSDVSEMLDKKTAQIKARLDTEDSNQVQHTLDKTSEYLTGTSTLFAVVLPQIYPPSLSTPNADKLACLLPHGIVSGSEQHLDFPFELAEPSSRFGLILLGAATN